MVARPTDQPDLNPARIAGDDLLREIAALIGYMDLHIGRHQIKQLTTRHKEMWADLVDSDAVLDALDENPSATHADYRRSVRWWRDKPARPLHEEGHAHGEQAVCRSCGKTITWDADLEKFWIPYEAGNPPVGTFHCPWGEPHWALPSGADEPDPFEYASETTGGTTGETTGETAPEPDTGGGSRRREPVSYDASNPAAMRVARHAVLDALQPDHPHRHRVAQDLIAVYEWAKQSAVPLRRTDGELGTLHAYPSASEATAFLDRYRESTP